MGKLVGDKKQKRFFRLVCTGFLLGFAVLLKFQIIPGGNEQAPVHKKVSETVAPEPDKTSAIEEPESEEVLSSSLQDVKVKGIYVTGPVAGSEKRMNKLTRLVETTELNAMVIDIKNDGGEITYKMDFEQAEKIGATKGYVSDMEGLVKDLKKKGIYLIARVVTFKDPILASKVPEYSIKNKDGSIFRDNKGLAWLNPYNRDVWKYVLNIAARTVLLGFDEIQFDYIRFPTAPGMENVTYGPEAEKISKQQIISEFTKCVTGYLKKGNVKVSADVFGGIISSEVDSKNIGQDYIQMSEYLDCICPMVYPSQFANGCYGVKNPDASPYEIVYRALKDSQNKLSQNEKVTVRPWLQDFTASWLKPHISYDGDEIRKQIQAVYASGYDEWILWNAGNSYSTGGLN